MLSQDLNDTIQFKQKFLSCTHVSRPVDYQFKMNVQNNQNLKKKGGGHKYKGHQLG